MLQLATLMITRPVKMKKLITLVASLKQNDNAVFSHLTSTGNLSNRIGEELG